MAVTQTTGKTLSLALGTGPQDGATIAALRLADRAVEKGHRVTVYAYGDGIRVGAVGSATSPHVEALIRAGLHGGLVSWVVDRTGVTNCTAAQQVPGVIEGDGGDLWRFVLDADTALGVTP